MPRSRSQPKADPRYQTVPEATILEMLLLAGWAFEVKAGARDLALSATHDALASWVEGGLGFRNGPQGERLFDPVEVTNFLKWAGLTGLDSFWSRHFVGTGRSLVASLRNGRTGAGLPPVHVQMTLRRTFALGNMQKGQKLRLRLPMLLIGGYVKQLEVETTFHGQEWNNPTTREESIELRTIVGDEDEIAVTAKYNFVATTPEAPNSMLMDAERELYLRGGEGVIRVTPRIVELAQALSGSEAMPRRSVEAFWNYLLDELICGAVRYSEVPPASPGDWVLDNGWYDCQLGSALLVSLCRARGIPARILSGHLLFRLAPTNHYWVEIWFEDSGWTPFDLLSWDLSEGGKDRSWRDAFAGQSDYRAVTQQMPLKFTGPMSVHFPQHWQMVQTAFNNGVKIAYTEPDRGNLIYEDFVSVEAC